MATNTDLFDLIQSLTRTEKAYFKKFAYKNDNSKDNPYLQLFDAIDRQQEYDEEKLLKKFRKEKFVKQFSVAKNYLLNLIVSSLADYDSNKNNRNRLLQMLREIRALKDRGATDLAQKRIDAALKLAEKYQDDWILYELYLMSVVLLPLQNSADRFDLYQKIQESLNAIQNMEDYRKVYGQYLQLGNSGSKVREEQNEQSWKDFMQHPLLQDSTKAITFATRYQFHEIWTNYHLRFKNSEAVYEQMQKQVELFGENDIYIETKPIIYLMTLNNLMFVQGILNKHEELEVTAQLILEKRNEKVIAPVAQIRPNIFYTLEGTLLAYYLELKHYKKAYEMIPKVRACNPEIFDHEKDRVFRNRFNMAAAYFYQKEYDAALDEVNELLGFKELDKESPDIGSFTRILDLLIHFELNNDLLIEYTSRSAYRYLYKHKKLYQVENIVLTFFKHLSKINDVSELQTAFEDLHESLLELKENPYEAGAFSYFHFLDWVEEKMEG
ncbi:MAG: hypothetical protein R3E32_16510 [Chitinophagales bacterium]